MNFTAASEATPSFGWNPSGSVRQPGPGFRSEHLWRPLNASLPFRCTLKGTRDTLLKNHPYAVGETMQRRSEGTTWVRSTRGQLKSTRGSRRGHRSAPLSRLGRRGAHACTRIFPSSTPWAWVETTRVWDGCMGHLAPLGEKQARFTSVHTPPLGARIQTTRAPPKRCAGYQR